MKAFVFDPLWDELITKELLKKIQSSGIELVVTKNIAPLSECKALFEGEEERLLCINPDYVNWKLASEDYKNIPNLKAILVASTGYEYVDTSFAKEKNIPVCNVRNFNNQSVAEWAIMMMFNLARQIPLLIKADFPLDYDKDYMTYKGVELKGKTAGIVGLGNIGKAIAERCKGLGMNVIYWSRSSRSDEYNFVELEDLFRESDVIFPALAKNKESQALFNDEMLKTIKPTSIFVDVVHDIFDHNKVVEMVKNKKLYGYGYEGKPGDFTKSPGNIWSAPAYAWDTETSLNNCMDKWVDNIVNASKDIFPNRING